MTPEQIADAIATDRANDAYNEARDSILKKCGMAYRAIVLALAEWQVLENRVAGGDLTTQSQKHEVMKAAMVGQQEVVQDAFTTCKTTLEMSQAIVFDARGAGFLPNVPTPQLEPEPEP